MKSQNGSILYFLLITATIAPLNSAITHFNRNPAWKEALAIGLVVVLQVIAVYVFKKHGLDAEFRKKTKNTGLWHFFAKYPLIFGLLDTGIGVLATMIVDAGLDKISTP
jgi:hypothetical protein